MGYSNKNFEDNRELKELSHNTFIPIKKVNVDGSISNQEISTVKFLELIMEEVKKGIPISYVNIFGELRQK